MRGTVLAQKCAQFGAPFRGRAVREVGNARGARDGYARRTQARDHYQQIVAHWLDTNARAPGEHSAQSAIQGLCGYCQVSCSKLAKSDVEVSRQRVT